jgi:hypothetical protein
LKTDASEGFGKVFQSVQNFILSHHHPMKLYKKIYVKAFTNFLPFYEEHQVDRFIQLIAINDVVRIVPKMERLYEFEEYQKRLVLMTSLSYQNWRQQFINTTDCDAFEAFKSCWN